jgi:hypothetical protein
MGTLAIADFLIESKRIAQMVDLINTGMGTGTQTNTPSKGAVNSESDIITAAAGDSEILNALLPGSVRLQAATLQSEFYGAQREWIRQLDDHVGGINDFLNTNTSRVHYNLRTVEPKILAKYTFPPVTDFGTYLLSGAGAGAFTAQDSVDTALYGDGLVELVTESLIGGANIEVTVVGLNYDGDTVQVTATINSATATDTTVAVNETTVRMASVTSVSVTGGTAADAFRVQTKFDRTPAGCA